MQNYHRYVYKAMQRIQGLQDGSTQSKPIHTKSLGLTLSAILLITAMISNPLRVMAQEASTTTYLPFTAAGSESVSNEQSEAGPFDFDTENEPELPADADGEAGADDVSALAANAGCISWPTMRRGQTGYWVYWVQRFLNERHGQRLVLDSNFGPATENAVRYVQQYWRNRGYTACGRTIGVDGIVGSQGWALLYYMRTPAASTNFVDRDHDGLDDNFENRVLQKFAPRIWLHGSEEHYPSTPEWFMTNSRMRFNHNNCKDHDVIAKGSVNANNIATQTHQGNKSFCRHDSGNIHHSMYSDYFFLDLENSQQSTRLHTSQWKLYGHVYKRSNGQIMVQYWQFYAYNRSGATNLSAGNVPINHEGDWEFTAVSIDSSERVQKIFFSQHVHTYERDVHEVDWIGDHHVTYSAKGSHAQYKSSGYLSTCNYTGWEAALDTCNTGTAWDSWGSSFGGIVNIGEKNYPLNNADWLKFAGKWGEIGHSKHTSGPVGPAQKDNWLR